MPEHFGEGGIGLYSCAFVYYSNEQKTDDKGAILYNEEGNAVMIPRKFIVYIDRVLGDGNWQH